MHDVWHTCVTTVPAISPVVLIRHVDAAQNCEHITIIDKNSELCNCEFARGLIKQITFRTIV